MKNYAGSAAKDRTLSDPMAGTLLRPLIPIGRVGHVRLLLDDIESGSPEQIQGDVGNLRECNTSLLRCPEMGSQEELEPFRARIGFGPGLRTILLMYSRALSHHEPI